MLIIETNYNADLQSEEMEPHSLETSDLLKKEPRPSTPSSPSHGLTVKLPVATPGLAHPFIDPSLDQKVSVTLTLSATAAEDIGGVISAIADLLKIAVPPTYEVTRSPSPEMFKLNMTRKLMSAD